MAEPIKDREYILAHKEEFLAALERARGYFKQFEGVASVGFGQKETGNVFQDNISLVISVAEKKNEADVPPDQRIPPSFEGFPTDVVVVKHSIPAVCNNNNPYDSIQGGIQICPNLNTAAVAGGTLGCIVRKKNDSNRENMHLLSNKHVLYFGGQSAGDYIYHPFPPPPPGFTSTDPSRALGPIAALSYYGDESYTPPGAASPRNFFLDCATARILIDSKCLGTTCTRDVIRTSPSSIIDLQLNGVDTISDVRSVIDDLAFVNQIVFKVGRTTGKTRGIVRRIDIGGTMPGDFNNNNSPTIPTSNVIEIDWDPASTANGLNCNGNPLFAEHGDSGSLVVDEQNRAVGLVYGVPPPNSTTGLSIGACHILPVLEKLGFCIPVTPIPALPVVTGISRCSCSATDGTGLAALPTTTGIGGGLASAINNGAIDHGLIQPEPLTEKQEERLTHLLEALRSTARGRELHAAFAHIRREISYLVRNVRPVTVTWHRNKGPAFFAVFLKHLRGDVDVFPHEMNGVRLSTLLDKMEPVLLENGSNPLKKIIGQYGDDIKAMLLSGNDVQGFIDYLEKKEPAWPTP